MPEIIIDCEKSPLSKSSSPDIESGRFFCAISKIKLDEFRQASRYWGPERLIAGNTRESARGSTAKTDGRSILIPWLAMAAGGFGDGDAVAVSVSGEFDAVGLAEAVALSVGVGDSTAVEVSGVAVEVSDADDSAVSVKSFSSANTGATIVTNTPATSRAPMRLAIKDGL